MYNKVLKERFVFCIILLFLVILVNPRIISTTHFIDGSTITVLEEVPGIEFSKTYGGWDSDWAESARQTKDGGYIIVGTTRALGPDLAEAGCLYKTDVIGNIEWFNIYGEPGPLNIDSPKSVEQTSDGGYIFTGITSSYGTVGSDIWLVKIDSLGNEIWNITYGGNGRDHGYQVLQADDGGFVVTGYTDSYGAGSQDMCLLKTNCYGIVEWFRTYGGKESDLGESVDKTDDGGYILSGISYSYGVDDFNLWIVKIDCNGIEEWNKTYGNFGALSSGKSVRQTIDGGYIVTGYKEIPDNNYTVPLMKIDVNGFMVWNTTFFEPQKHYIHVAEEVQQTKDGGYIIVGHTQPVGPYTSFLIKTDGYGNNVWELIFDDYYIYLRSVEQTIDGGYILGGHRHTPTYNNVMDDYLMIKVGHVPDIKIIKPEKALYLFNTKMIPLPFRSRIIGPIDVEVTASDDEYKIEKVSFYVDDVFQEDDTSEPYSWNWNKLSLFRHRLKAVVFNSNGNVGIEEIVVSKFF